MNRAGGSASSRWSVLASGQRAPARRVARSLVLGGVAACICPDSQDTPIPLTRRKTATMATIRTHWLRCRPIQPATNQISATAPGTASS